MTFSTEHLLIALISKKEDSILIETMVYTYLCMRQSLGIYEYIFIHLFSFQYSKTTKQSFSFARLYLDIDKVRKAMHL